MMKKEYISPKAEKLEFNFAEVVTTSGASDKNNCMIISMGASWQDSGNYCQTSIAGD